MRILLVFQSILFYLVYHYTILSLLQINDKHYLSLVDYDVDVVDYILVFYHHHPRPSGTATATAPTEGAVRRC